MFSRSARISFLQFKLYSVSPRNFSAASLSSPSTFSSTDLSKDRRTIRIKTCQKVYSDSTEARYIFKKCPKDGIFLDIDYLDTNPDGDEKIPTVLAVHGAPGNYEDYTSLIERFKLKGFRIIAPNFPGLKYTDETGTFRHTTEEKAEFLSDFFREINIKKIDVALMHSSAVYPCLKVWKDQPDLVKSLVMINPAGHRTIKAMKPEWFISNCARLNLTPVGRKIFNAVGQKLIATKGVAVKIDNLNNVIWACLTMFLAKVQRLEGYLQLLKERKTPTVYFFGEKDKLVDTAIFYEMAEMLGADKSNIHILDKEGRVTQGASSNPNVDEWLRIFSFKEGGHYAFKSYTDIIDAEVTHLLARVWADQALTVSRRIIPETEKKKRINARITADDTNDCQLDTKHDVGVKHQKRREGVFAVHIKS